MHEPRGRTPHRLLIHARGEDHRHRRRDEEHQGVSDDEPEEEALLLARLREVLTAPLNARLERELTRLHDQRLTELERRAPAGIDPVPRRTLHPRLRARRHRDERQISFPANLHALERHALFTDFHVIDAQRTISPPQRDREDPISIERRSIVPSEHTTSGRSFSAQFHAKTPRRNGREKTRAWEN